VTAICVGRFILGIAAGILNLCMAKSCYETVPQSLSGTFGVLTNLYIAFSMMLATITGILLPSDSADYNEDRMWRVVFSLPILFAVLQMLIMLIYFREEPVGYCIALKRDDEAIRFVKKIYSVPKGLSE
jgi:MFS family permease